jgi:hypothetical protein
MRTNISNDQVNASRGSSDIGVQGAGPDLSVGTQGVGVSPDDKVEGLKRGVLAGGDLEEPSGRVQGSTSGLLISIEGTLG